MVDMFTILLVFLLMNYSHAEVQLEPIQGLKLPSSDSMQNPSRAPKISLTKNELRVGEKVVATLSESKFAGTDLDAKDPEFVPTFFRELEALSEGDDGVKDGQMLLQADARLPYETLRKVFYTASMAGFPKLKLVTIIGN